MRKALNLPVLLSSSYPNAPFGSRPCGKLKSARASYADFVSSSMGLVMMVMGVGDDVASGDRRRKKKKRVRLVAMRDITEKESFAFWVSLCACDCFCVLSLVMENFSICCFLGEMVKYGSISLVA